MSFDEDDRLMTWLRSVDAISRVHDHRSIFMLIF